MIRKVLFIKSTKRVDPDVEGSTGRELEEGAQLMGASRSGAERVEALLA